MNIKKKKNHSIFQVVLTCSVKVKMSQINKYGQTVGGALYNWTACANPEGVSLTGRTCRLEPLDVIKHADELFEAYSESPDGRDWTYLYEGEFEDIDSFKKCMVCLTQGTDPRLYAIISLTTGKAIGIFSLVRQNPIHGVIEVGHVAYSPLLKKTIEATEAQFLLMSYVFDKLGYRRYEWLCDSLNDASSKAALRLGFKYEGLFRKAVVYKNRTADTAWFSIISDEWPALKLAFQAWLAPDNFDNNGQQIKPLATFQKNIEK